MISLEYIAGFFDGEGSVGVYKNGRGTFHLRTQITQNVTRCSRPLFEALQVQFGGNLSDHQSLTKNRYFNWQLNGTGAAKFLKEILPHLRLKTEQAQVAIAWQASKLQPSRDRRGRMNPIPARAEDFEVALLLKAMKRTP